MNLENSSDMIVDENFRFEIETLRHFLVFPYLQTQSLGDKCPLDRSMKCLPKLCAIKVFPMVPYPSYLEYFLFSLDSNSKSG